MGTGGGRTGEVPPFTLAVFRYMQGAIERRHGPVVAIAVVTVFFVLAHFSDVQAMSAPRILFIAVASVIYGILVHLSGSIVPGLRALLPRGCSFRVRTGERIVLEGSSGSGKSTLASILSGAQFHENHVLSESFAFNLLMGRNWPPQSAISSRRCPRDSRKWSVKRDGACRTENRAASSSLARFCRIVLDESFAALDPETLQRAIDCVVRRAPALVVIAHP